MLPDEQKAKTVGVHVRAVSWLNGQGIACRRVYFDNGSDYISRESRQTGTVLGLKAKQPWAYRPNTNDKADRFIKTLREK